MSMRWHRLRHFFTVYQSPTQTPSIYEQIKQTPAVNQYAIIYILRLLLVLK